MNRLRHKIVHVLTSVRDGGLEKIVLDVCTKLPQNDFESIVCTLLDENSGIDAFTASGIRIQSFSAQNRGGLSVIITNLASVFRLALFLLKEKPTTLIVHDFFPGVLGRVAGVLAFVPNKIAVLHATYDWLGVKAGFVNRILGLITNSLVCVSVAAKDSSLQRDRVPLDKYRIIYNGIDTSYFSLDQLKRTALRKAIGVSDDEIVIGCVGVLRESKRQLDLLKAMREVWGAYPAAKLLLVGSERSHETNYSDQIHKAIGAAPENSVIHLRNQKDMQSIYSAIDVFVTASESEGFGLALAEAMSCTVPCIATRIPAHLEIGGQSNSVDFYAVGNIQELASKIMQFLEDPHRRLEKAKLSRSRIDSEFSQDAMIANWCALLRD